MSRTRKRVPPVEDPHLRKCTACGAGIGEGCRNLGINDTRRLYASRLVHADRLEEQSNG